MQEGRDKQFLLARITDFSEKSGQGVVQKKKSAGWKNKHFDDEDSVLEVVDIVDVPPNIPTTYM